MVALNYGEFHPERVSNIKPFANKYKLKGKNYPSKIHDWIMFEKNNLPIALNILYIKEKQICPANISKINLNCEKQIILSMIPNEEKEGWYCLSFRTENKLKSREKVCKNKDFCGIVMPSQKNYILEFNQYMKSNKMPYTLFMLTLNL